MKISGAIFDMDGTLINSLHFWDEYFSQIGQKYLSDPNFTPDYQTLRRMRSLTIGDGQRLLYERYGFGADSEELVHFAYEKCEYFYRNLVTVKDGVIEFLDFLKENQVPMCIASATERRLLEITVERFGFDYYFPTVVSCSDVGYGKERPDVFLRAREILGSSLDSTFVFEDSIVAIETSVKAGFGTVGIYDKRGIEHDKMEKISSFYIGDGHSMAELIPMIEVVK